jgi:hypothetical protein
VSLYSRLGNDLTDRFRLIVETLANLRTRSCIIDGEAVACETTASPCSTGFGVAATITRSSYNAKVQHRSSAESNRSARVGSSDQRWRTGRGQRHCAERDSLRPRQGHYPLPFASSCRAAARSRETFFIARCRSMRTLSLKDRRDGLRIQRTHRQASTPKACRKKARRYRPLTPSWRSALSAQAILKDTAKASLKSVPRTHRSLCWSWIRDLLIANHTVPASWQAKPR